MTKNDDGRVVYMTPEVKHLMIEPREPVKELERHIGKVIAWLFPHLRGAHQGERLQDFKKAWKTACQRAGYPGMLRYDFR